MVTDLQRAPPANPLDPAFHVILGKYSGWNLPKRCNPVRNRTLDHGFTGWEASGGDLRKQEQTILVVEDEASVRLAISDYLTEQGFTVLQAAAASGAIDVIALHPEIDLVFTDLAMPGDLDGLDLVDWLLKHHPGMPVVVASGLGGRVSTMAEFSRNQALSYFVKPYPYDAVVKRIREVIQDRAP
jgi:CheY-like chemotaxis protein